MPAESPALSCPVAADPVDARLSRLVGDYLAPVWRTMRRLGMSSGEADDATQQVMVLAARVSGLIASNPLADVDALHQPQPLQQLQRAIDAGKPHAAAPLVEQRRDLARGHAAAQLGQRFDHGRARRARAMPSTLE